MSSKTPRTRRQLRDALYDLRRENLDLEHRVSSAFDALGEVFEAARRAREEAEE